MEVNKQELNGYINNLKDKVKQQELDLTQQIQSAANKSDKIMKDAILSLKAR